MKAIIVAAGRGRRLGVETDAIPKCMVKVGGRPILHWQLDALAAAGVDEVVIVRGYLGHEIAPSTAVAKVRFVDNPEWASNNILTSLFFAQTEMTGGFLFTYSDIVFAPEHARLVAAAPGPVALVIDRRWREAYEGRVLHPVSEAELARVEGAGETAIVRRVGKRLVTAEEAAGEFTGLARFSPEGADALCDVWRPVARDGLDRPFGAAATGRQAYLSDGLNALVDRGVALRPVLVDGRWREIDTEEDLARAETAVASWSS
jgi:L-glutamine-phosphate cytidylyltransferase